jgi:Tfp pilus assembly protein PilV
VNARNRQAGFTLVEIAVTTAIVALAVIGLATLFATSSRANLLARERGEAQRVAQEVVEYFRGHPFGVVSSYADQPGTQACVVRDRATGEQRTYRCFDFIAEGRRGAVIRAGQEVRPADAPFVGPSGRTYTARFWVSRSISATASSAAIPLAGASVNLNVMVTWPTAGRGEVQEYVLETVYTDFSR